VKFAFSPLQIRRRSSPLELQPDVQRRQGLESQNGQVSLPRLSSQHSLQRDQVLRSHVLLRWAEQLLLVALSHLMMIFSTPKLINGGLFLFFFTVKWRGCSLTHLETEGGGQLNALAKT